MGLIKSVVSSAKSTFADQWLEFVTLENDNNDVLVTRGIVTRTGKNKGDGHVISNGSRIAVPEGWAMMIIEQGKVAEFSAEPGEFTYDSGSEPSIFYGGLGQGIVNSFKQWGDRVKFGGEIPKDTRVYYVNIREIMNNKYGTSTPVPFDDIKYQSIDIRFYGQFSLKVSDPIVLVKNIIGTTGKNRILISEFMPQLKAEFMSNLTTALVKLGYEKNISYNKLPMYQVELNKIMNDILDEEWNQNRGLVVVSTALESVSVDNETKKKIDEYDKMYFAEQHSQGMMNEAIASGIKTAAGNENGMAGVFMGMNAGGMMSGAMQGGIYHTQNNVQPNNTMNGGWICACGQQNTGNFCPSCGAKRPEMKKFCPSCGKEVNSTQNFCDNCGCKLG